MQPCDFLNKVEKLLADTPIMPDVPVCLTLCNYKLHILTQNQLNDKHTVIFKFSKLHRQRGLSSNEWQRVFGEMFKHWSAGQLKIKKEPKSCQPPPKH